MLPGLVGLTGSMWSRSPCRVVWCKRTGRPSSGIGRYSGRAVPSSIRQVAIVRYQVGHLRIILQSVDNLLHVIYSCPSGRAIIGGGCRREASHSSAAWSRTSTGHPHANDVSRPSSIGLSFYHLHAVGIDSRLVHHRDTNAAVLVPATTARTCAIGTVYLSPPV